MKIRILDTVAMGTDFRLNDGDIVEVFQETENTLRRVDDCYCFDNEWQDKYFEFVDETATKLSPDMYVDVQGWSGDKIKKAAEMFSEHTGYVIWNDSEALVEEGMHHYLLVNTNSSLLGVFSEMSLHDKKEISQDNFNQLLEEWEMVNTKVSHTVQNGDYVFTKDLTTEQYEELGDALVKAGFVGEYPGDQYCWTGDEDWVFGVDEKGENYHGDYSSCCFKDGRHLSFEEFMKNLNVHKDEAVIPLTGNGGSIGVNLTTKEAHASDSKSSLVQRITLTHKAALQACQEATEAYNDYKQAVDELKEEVGDGFKIEEVKWEDMFGDAPVDVNQDMADWRNWKVGDVVECIGDNDEFEIGQRMTVTDTETPCYGGAMPIQLDDLWAYPGTDGEVFTEAFKWISRPS